MSILILGLPGSGKSTLAKVISEKTNYPIINCDDYRYGENWRKKSLHEYMNEILQIVDKFEHNMTPFILEGTCNDTSDPENARRVVMEKLLSKFDRIIIIKPEGLAHQIENLVTRSINRAKGVEPQGASVETPKSVAQLIIKNVQSYDANIEVLSEFVRKCASTRFLVYDVRDEIYKRLDKGIFIDSIENHIESWINVWNELMQAEQ